MLKGSKNKMIHEEDVKDKTVEETVEQGELKTFFFPSVQVSVQARSQQEADEKLKEELSKSRTDML